MLKSVFHVYFSFLLNPLCIVWGIKRCREMESRGRISRRSLTLTTLGLGKEAKSRRGMGVEGTGAIEMAIRQT